MVSSNVTTLDAQKVDCNLHQFIIDCFGKYYFLLHSYTVLKEAKTIQVELKWSDWNPPAVI